jgi:hypothetical protein
VRRAISLCHNGLVSVVCVRYLGVGGMALGITSVVWAARFVSERVHSTSEIDNLPCRKRKAVDN